MKKTTFLFLLLFVFSLLVTGTSCSKKDAQPDAAPFLHDTVYRVGIQIGEYEGQGEITLSQDGTVHLFHTDSTSPLFTMEEIIEKDRIRCKFYGMEWESEEASPYSARLYEIFQILFNREETESERESIRGEDAIKDRYQWEEKCLIFYRTKENAPIQLLFSEPGGKMEISFELPKKPQ